MSFVRNAREFSREFVINDLPEDQREYLLLKDVRKSISTKAEVSIAVRGRVIQPRSDGKLMCDGDEKPLHLLITAKSKHELEKAMQEVQGVLASYVSARIENNVLNEDDSLEDKITVGINVWPAQFCMKSRILGENGEFVEYIEKETGAIITLRGRGSNYGDDNKYDEPLHVYIKYENSSKKEKTRELVLNLIGTVQSDFLDLYAKYYAKPKKPEIIPVLIQNVPKPSDDDKIVHKNVVETRNDTDKITVGFDCAPRNFDLKAKIYGPNYAHTEHIEREGGALILLQGRGCRFPEKDDVDEPPHLLVKYQDLALKSKARELIFNLLESVHHDYIRLYGTAPINPAKPRIVLYNPKPTPTRKKSRERSVSPKQNSDYSRRLDTSPLPKYQNIPSSVRRSNTPPSSRRLSPPPLLSRVSTSPISRHSNSPPSSPPPAPRGLNTQSKPSRSSKTPPSSLRRRNTSPSLSRRPHSPSTSRRPNSPHVSRRPYSPQISKRLHSPSMSRRPHSPPISRRQHSPPISRRPHSPPTSRRPHSPPVSKHPNSPPTARRQHSPPISRRPHSPPLSRRPLSPPVSKHPNSSPISRRPNTPPKSSRRLTSHQSRSRSPVLAPPPPVISSSEPCDKYNSTSDLLPPIIPPLMDSVRTKPLLPHFLCDDFVKPKRQVGNAESHHQWKKSQMDLSEPVQEFKNPEFYMMQSKQPIQFIVPSFSPQPNFVQQKYVKKREISPESSTNNTFTESKKYCPPFSNSMDTRMDHIVNVEPPSKTPQKQINKINNNRVRHRSLVQISFKEEFAVPQELSKIQSTPTSNTSSVLFNSNEYKNKNTPKFAIQPNVSVLSRKQQNKQMEKQYHINDDHYYSSDSEDAASVICLDSEDDFCYPEKPTSSTNSVRKPIEKPTSTTFLNSKPMSFSVKVQTEKEDEVLKNKKLQCVCGNFTHFLTGVRSRAVQTDPERYCRY